MNRKVILILSIALLGCLDAQAQTDEGAGGQPVTQEKVLSNMFKASVGPGLIYSDFYAPGRIYKRHSCMDFDFTYDHVWKSGWGFGVNYAFNYIPRRTLSLTTSLLDLTELTNRILFIQQNH